MGMQCLHQRQKRHVKAQHLVFGVVGDPCQLLGVQARVHGVQHAARATHTKVQLQMAVTVPGQGGDACALRHLLGIECVGHLTRAAGHIGPGVTVDVALHAARNNFTVAVVFFCKLDQ